MSRYYPLTIARIEPQTAESVSVWLEVPAPLKEQFRFIPGQYLNCRAIIDGEEVRKSYSICSIPEDGYMVIGVKLVYGGRFSTYINRQLRAGDTLDVTPAEGRFTLPDHLPEEASLVFFAAGSGITPVISLIRHFLLHFPKGQAILFYSNKSSDTIMFREQLEGLKNKHMMRFSIYHVLTREVTGVELLSGRIDSEKCRIFGRHFFNPAEVHTTFICGPEIMILDIRESLRAMGLREDQIRFELFGTAPAQVRERRDIPSEVIGEDKLSRVTVRIDGHEADFQIRYGGAPVLDVALQSGLDIPYSCKGGVCSTCRALVVEGQVHMDIHYGLEPDEIDAGYVLTCQAHPRSERVILDYDIL